MAAPRKKKRLRHTRTTDTSVTSLDLNEDNAPLFVVCTDCGCRLADGLVGTTWCAAQPGAPLIPWNVAPRYPPAQYGPPAGAPVGFPTVWDWAVRCPDCYERATGAREMAYVPLPRCGVLAVDMTEHPLYAPTQQVMRLLIRVVHESQPQAAMTCETDQALLAMLAELRMLAHHEAADRLALLLDTRLRRIAF